MFLLNTCFFQAVFSCGGDIQLSRILTVDWDAKAAVGLLSETGGQRNHPETTVAESVSFSLPWSFNAVVVHSTICKG